MKKSGFFMRSACALLSVVFLTTNCSLLQANESIFNERRRKATQMAQAPSQTWASLPTAPRVSISALKDTSSTVNFPASLGRLENLPASESSAKNKIIYYVQDIHGNDEAQANISAAVKRLIEDKQIGLLALEGSPRPVDLQNLRELGDSSILTDESNQALDKHLISGAVHAALTTAHSIPPVTGIEEPSLYQANVRAYLTSVPKMEAVGAALKKRQEKLAAAKRSQLNRELYSFDQKIEGYRSKQVPLGTYVEELAAHSFATPGVESFLKAAHLERTVSFDQATAERTRMLEKLSNRMDRVAQGNLLDLAARYRLGTVNHAAFYGQVKQLCADYGVKLSDYPAMEGYIRYVLLTDSIKPGQLWKDLSAMEDAAYSRLIKTSEEEDLLAQSRQVYLQNQLVHFSLTNEEWQLYRASYRTNEKTFKSFEAFYENAEKRNHAMVTNLFKAMERSKADSAILVTGGFHSDGMSALIKEQHASIVMFTPRISKADADGSLKALSEFSQEKSPLDQLFEGRKLFLSKDQAPPAALGWLATRIICRLPANRLTNALLKYRVITGLDVIEVSRRKEGVQLSVRMPNGIAAINVPYVENGKLGEPSLSSGDFTERARSLIKQSDKPDVAALLQTAHPITLEGIDSRNPEDSLLGAEETFLQLTEDDPQSGFSLDNTRGGQAEQVRAALKTFFEKALARNITTATFYRYAHGGRMHFVLLDDSPGYNNPVVRQVPVPPTLGRGIIVAKEFIQLRPDRAPGIMTSFSIALPRTEESKLIDAPKDVTAAKAESAKINELKEAAPEEFAHLVRLFSQRFENGKRSQLTFAQLLLFLRIDDLNLVNLAAKEIHQRMLLGTVDLFPYEGHLVDILLDNRLDQPISVTPENSRKAARNRLASTLIFNFTDIPAAEKQALAERAGVNFIDYHRLEQEIFEDMYGNRYGVTVEHDQDGPLGNVVLVCKPLEGPFSRMLGGSHVPEYKLKFSPQFAGPVDLNDENVRNGFPFWHIRMNLEVLTDWPLDSVTGANARDEVNTSSLLNSVIGRWAEISPSGKDSKDPHCTRIQIDLESEEGDSQQIFRNSPLAQALKKTRFKLSEAGREKMVFKKIGGEPVKLDSSSAKSPLATTLQNAVTTLVSFDGVKTLFKLNEEVGWHWILGTGFGRINGINPHESYIFEHMTPATPARRLNLAWFYLVAPIMWGGFAIALVGGLLFFRNLIGLEVVMKLDVLQVFVLLLSPGAVIGTIASAFDRRVKGPGSKLGRLAVGIAYGYIFYQAPSFFGFDIIAQLSLAQMLVWYMGIFGAIAVALNFKERPLKADNTRDLNDLAKGLQLLKEALGDTNLGDLWNHLGEIRARLDEYVTNVQPAHAPAMAAIPWLEWAQGFWLMMRGDSGIRMAGKILQSGKGLPPGKPWKKLSAKDEAVRPPTAEELNKYLQTRTVPIQNLFDKWVQEQKTDAPFKMNDARVYPMIISHDQGRWARAKNRIDDPTDIFIGSVLPLRDDELSAYLSEGAAERYKERFDSAKPFEFTLDIFKSAAAAEAFYRVVLNKPTKGEKARKLIQDGQQENHVILEEFAAPSAQIVATIQSGERTARAVETLRAWLAPEITVVAAVSAVSEMWIDLRDDDDITKYLESVDNPLTDNDRAYMLWVVLTTLGLLESPASYIEFNQTQGGGFRTQREALEPVSTRAHNPLGSFSFSLPHWVTGLLRITPTPPMIQPPAPQISPVMPPAKVIVGEVPAPGGNGPGGKGNGVIVALPNGVGFNQRNESGDSRSAGEAQRQDSGRTAQPPSTINPIVNNAGKTNLSSEGSARIGNTDSRGEKNETTPSESASDASAQFAQAKAASPAPATQPNSQSQGSATPSQAAANSSSVQPDRQPNTVSPTANTASADAPAGNVARAPSNNSGVQTPLSNTGDNSGSAARNSNAAPVVPTAGQARTNQTASNQNLTAPAASNATAARSASRAQTTLNRNTSGVIIENPNASLRQILVLSVVVGLVLSTAAALILNLALTAAVPVIVFFLSASPTFLTLQTYSAYHPGTGFLVFPSLRNLVGLSANTSAGLSGSATGVSATTRSSNTLFLDPNHVALVEIETARAGNTVFGNTSFLMQAIQWLNPNGATARMLSATTNGAPIYSIPSTSLASTTRDPSSARALVAVAFAASEASERSQSGDVSTGNDSTQEESVIDVLKRWNEGAIERREAARLRQLVMGQQLAGQIQNTLSGRSANNMIESSAEARAQSDNTLTPTELVQFRRAALILLENVLENQKADRVNQQIQDKQQMETIYELLSNEDFLFRTPVEKTDKPKNPVRIFRLKATTKSPEPETPEAELKDERNEKEEKDERAAKEERDITELTWMAAVQTAAAGTAEENLVGLGSSRDVLRSLVNGDLPRERRDRLMQDTAMIHQASILGVTGSISGSARTATGTPSVTPTTQSKIRAAAEVLLNGLEGRQQTTAPSTEVDEVSPFAGIGATIREASNEFYSAIAALGSGIVPANWGAKKASSSRESAVERELNTDSTSEGTADATDAMAPTITPAEATKLAIALLTAAQTHSDAREQKAGDLYAGILPAISSLGVFNENEANPLMTLNAADLKMVLDEMEASIEEGMKRGDLSTDAALRLLSWMAANFGRVEKLKDLIGNRNVALAAANLNQEQIEAVLKVLKITGRKLYLITDENTDTDMLAELQEIAKDQLIPMNSESADLFIEREGALVFNFQTVAALIGTLDEATRNNLLFLMDEGSAWEIANFKSDPVLQVLKSVRFAFLNKFLFGSRGEVDKIENIQQLALKIKTHA